MNGQELRDKLAPYRDCETNVEDITVDGIKKLIVVKLKVEAKANEPSQKAEVKK